MSEPTGTPAPGPEAPAKPSPASAGVLLHVGCGRAPLPPELAERGWREIRYDIDPAVEPDLVGSITAMDRIADGSIDAIWSSHNLEHLADPDVPRALAEFLRVLRPGGVAWIALPDVQSLAERIASGELDAPLYHSPAGPISAADILWGHQAALAAGRTWMANRTGFSAATLERRLLAAGFAPVQVERRPAAFELFATAHRPLPLPPFDPCFEQGRRLHAEGAWVEAEAFYRQALARHPQDWRVRLELALVCFAQQRLEEAVVELGQVVLLEPRLARAQLALGTFLAMLGRQAEALGPLRRAVELEPGSAEAHVNLGNCCSQQELVAEAERAYREALRLDPGRGLAAINLGRIRYDQGHPLEGLALYRTGLRTVAEPSLHSNLPMMMNFTAEVDDGAVMEAHHAFDRRIVEPLAAEIRPPLAPSAPEERLRLGYVSRDLRRHSLRYFLLPIFEHHDHGAFEIVCYFDAENGDEVTDRFRALADRWVPCHGWSDERLAGQIRDDRIDILVDLAGHTDRNRLPVFARRPAPLQLTYLGYPATTGVRTIDYRISDCWIDPLPPAAPLPSSETPLRLEHGYFCYAPIPGSPPVTALPCEALGVLTFSCLNQAIKLNGRLFACWAEILRAVPGSRLWLQNASLDQPATRERLEQAFAALGVGRERLLFRGPAPAPDYLRSYHQIDIALDSYPYNGGTTSCEALWMGVPVVSWCGGRHVARLGASLLHQVGLGDLVAASPGEYVALAVALAGDRERLRSLRATMRERLLASPLMDHAGFTRELEGALRAAWVQRLRGRPGCGSG